MPLTVPPLTAIIDVEAAQRARWRPLDVASAFLAGGATLIQLRAKRISASEFLDLAGRIAEFAHAAGAHLIINDRADIARLAAADGVHVGQGDLPAVEARKLVGAAKIVGVSTHNIEQAQQAVLDGADYIGVGPVFRSPTKPRDFLPGLDFARQVAEQIQLFIDNNVRVLRSIGLELQGVDLQQWQQTRVLKDYLLEFPEFREVSFFAAGGRKTRPAPRLHSLLMTL